MHATCLFLSISCHVAALFLCNCMQLVYHDEVVWNYILAGVQDVCMNTLLLEFQCTPNRDQCALIFFGDDPMVDNKS